MSIIFKSKIPPWAVVFPEIENIIANPAETPFCVGIPYGFQLHKEIWNHERLRVVHNVNTATGHSFISHHGVGKKNQINIWNFSKETQAGNSRNGFQSIFTDLKFLHILFAQRRWVYVMFCTDLSMRIFSAKFHALSTTAVNKTVLCLAYNEIRDEILTGVAGGIMTWRFPIGQTDPLIPGQLISCSFTPFDWVMSIMLDNTTKQILAISEVSISMIDIATHKERCFFQKKCDYSFTTCVFYSPASYFITGDKNGSIRAWSTSLNSFPMVTQFLGHTAEITKLLVHPKEPLLVSSSLDETIRVWNFDTCALTFKLETGEKIIEMELLSADLLYYHSDHHVKIWSLNLFHSLFTVLISRIKRWTRVKSPGYTSRVVVLAEDGGVRLVSPVHGYELTTMLPITTMTADIVDVAHDPRQEKIYLVLSTREVLVFESDTNPCCAYQLWVAESPDEGVCSLVMINSEFALYENEIPLKSGLLFAGHYNGQISLLSGKDVYMKENVQAHQGQVTFLRISASFAGSHDNLAAHDHLVSCGTDLTVRIWQIIHPELNRVSIQQKALVKLLQSPTDLTMAGNTLCMAMADNSVVMCRVRAQEKRGGANIFNRVKETYEFLTHSKDERHTAPINGLSCCSTLGLFATSSEDHSVKLWNCDNQLVREMSFDESLCGVCFANSRGDILVGFQSHISLVTILNYLPMPYLEILSKMNFDNDPFEDLVQFDDLLKFWYDPDRVPRMPLAASKRRPLEPPEVKKPTKRKKKEAIIIKQKTEEEEEMDLFQKRRRSRRLSTQVHVMMALRRYSQSTSSSRASLLKIVASMKELVTEEPITKTEPQDREAAPMLSSEQVTAKVYWPCAPDGYIPNSVIRKRVKPRKPPARLIPRMRRPEPKKEVVKEEGEEDEQSINRITDFWTLFQLMQASLVKEKIGDKGSKKKGKKEGRKKRKLASKLGRKLAPRSRAGKSDEESEEEVEIEEEEEEEPEPEVSDQLVEEEKEDHHEEVSEKSPESSLGGSGSQLVETPKEMSEESEEENNVYISDIDEFQSSPSEGGSTTSVVMKLEITSSESSLLTRIVRKKWYPKLEQRRRMIPKVGDVIDNMLDVLKKMNNLKTIQDIFEQFMNVEREFGIPEDKKVEFQNQLIKLSYNEDARKRQTAVWALGEMGVHREDAYLTVVRRLVDNDKGTREEAKRVLKNLTGVNTMEGLTELIMKLGVVHLQLPCNDNAVLMELAMRLTQQRKKKQMTELSKEDSEKSTSLDNLRTTLRRKPFKAKFKHPKTMDRRLRGTRRTQRRPSILDEPASLANTEKLKDTLKKSKLGCKLLQQMGPIRDGIIPRHSLRSSGNSVEPKSIEFGGASLSPIRQVQQDEKSMQLNARFIHTSKSRQSSHEDSPVTPTARIASVTPISRSPAYQTRLTISSQGGTIISLESPESKNKPDNVDIQVTSDYDKQKSQKARESPRSEIVQEPKEAQWKNINGTKTSEGHSSELLSLTQILQAMDGIMGINQRRTMLQLLKMKRMGRIIPQNITLEDKTIQQFYSVADLLELICQFPQFDGVLTNLAHKMSISKEEILMNMRGLFRSECPITIERGDHVIITGLGRLPLKYHETLLRRRNGLLQNIDGYVGNVASLTTGEGEVARTFHSRLEGMLLLCARLEPELEMEEEFLSAASSVASQERFQVSDRKTRAHYIGLRKKMGHEMPPIFVQPSLHHPLGPGTHGQRLLDTTLIRARALSDSRLQSSRKTQDFVVTALPHRLSIHTGTKIEGESHFGIMELTWRAGTPLRQMNEEIPHNAKNSNFPQLSGKPVELKEPIMLDNHGKEHCQSKIPKSQSVPPLSHRKVKPFAEKKLNLFRAVNSLNEHDSLEALGKYIINQTIIKKGDLLPGSFTDHPPSPNTTHPTSFHASLPLPSLNNDSMTSVMSGDSSGRCLQFCEPPRDMTGDTLLSELNKYHLPPISKVGGQNRSP